MSSPQAIVSKILTYSVVDGPGNRFVVFLQGCNFNCLNCHNPHTISLCDNCGDCIPACHANALSLVEGKIHFTANACDQCDDCIKACPISANPMVQTYSVDEMLARIRENQVFIDGITMSGGEATTQLKFIIALFKAIKQEPELKHLTCFIDTNGHLGEASWAKVLPYTDGVLLDIKAFEDETHQFLTGKSNARARRSAEILQAAGKLAELRFLVIPGQTDNQTEIAKLQAFAQKLGPDIKLRLNAFQHHGVVGAALNWPKTPKATIEDIAAQLRDNGATQVKTPDVYA